MVYRGKEKRKYQRYSMETKVNFYLNYDLKTKVKFKIINHDKTKAKKYEGLSRNICAEGMRFCSEKKLRKGDRLFLEVYLPRRSKPIPMIGVVCWSKQVFHNVKDKSRFDTGVELISVKGRSVVLSIHPDYKYHVPWSTVLESVFGGFKKSLHRKSKPRSA